jgi:cyclophilin family peptidyl-prolyl cis-trans isomerase/protein-disulfide isomerase
MRKALLPILFVLALLLSACGTAQTQSTSVAAPTTAVVPTPTLAPYTDEKTPCKSLNILDFMLYSMKVKIAEASADEWIDGSVSAPITMILYTDLQCPYCSKFDEVFRGVVKAYPNDVRLVFRHWPLSSIHPNAEQAAIAAEAAGKQGKFFVMTDFLFVNQAEWSGKTSADFSKWLQEKSTTVGLDATQFAKDLTDATIVKKVKDAKKTSDTLFEQLSIAMPEAGGFGTPTLFIDNYLFRAQEMSVKSISFIVDLIKFNKTNTLECPAMSIDQNKDYKATISTTKGDILVDLLEKEAPVSVNSFISLTKKGWFNNNVIFTTDQVILSGDKSNTSYGNAGYAFVDENRIKFTFDKEGMLALPNFGPGTNGSQFFINKVGVSAINGRYTIFGTVTQGMDVVKSLVSYDETMPLDKADKIVSITITPE